MFGSAKKRKAQRLHAEGEALMGTDDDGAIRKFEQALALVPEKAESYYNIGLIHKYRSAWTESLRFNQMALRYEPEDDAAKWNTAIAATALGDWKTARKVWANCGIEVSGEEGPINDNFGQTPVRLNPDDLGEVVWARRLCPVRARIYSIPFPESGFSYADVVLHDGAGTGSREWDGRSYAVFNVLEIAERSDFDTHVFTVDDADDEDIVRLQEDVAEVGAAEDWTSNVRFLCRQCSEGEAHESCDTELATHAGTRRVAVAVRNAEELERVHRWATACRARIEKI